MLFGHFTEEGLAQILEFGFPLAGKGVGGGLGLLALLSFQSWNRFQKAVDKVSGVEKAADPLLISMSLSPSAEASSGRR